MEKFTIKRKVVIEEEVTYHKYIALKIQTLRKQKEYTQESFADKLGVSRVSIVNIEKGRQQVTMKMLYLICNALDVSSQQILPF